MGQKIKEDKVEQTLKPVKVDNEVAIKLVQPARVLCHIEVRVDDKYKLGKTAEKRLEDFKLLCLC